MVIYRKKKERYSYMSRTVTFDSDGNRYKQVRAFNVCAMMSYMDYTPKTLKEILTSNK